MGLRPFVNRKIPLLTTFGQNTLSVYLFHGFVVWYITARQRYFLTTPLRVLLVTAAILAVFGNPLVGKGMKFLLSERWFDCLVRGWVRGKAKSENT